MTCSLRAGVGLSLVAVVALGACSHQVAKAPGADAASAARPAVPSQSVVGHVLGSIAERTIGPFLARSESAKGGMVGWISGAEGATRRVIAIPVSSVGEPKGGTRTIASVGIDATMLVVRSTRGKVPGFAFAWTVLTDRGESLWSVVLNADGVPRGKPIELARTMDDVVWVDIVPTDAGAVCVWAEETREGDANVLAAGLDDDGKVRGAPSRIARGASGWHALEVPGGVGISMISPPSPSAPAPVPPGAPVAVSAPRHGTLSFQRLEADGHPHAGPVAIVSQATVSGDVEVVRTPSRLVFAWTDRSTEDSAIAVAALKEDGTVEPSRRIVESPGGATLLGLASGPAGTAILYEAPSRKGVGDARHVYGAHISASLGVEGRAAAIEVIGRATPELVAIDTGFAILAPQRDCEPGSPRCLDAGVLPTIVRTDARLALVQREPLGFGTDPASMAWGMTCDPIRCVALAASGPAPARIRAAEVRRRQNVAPRAVAKVAVASGPHVTDVTAPASGQSIVDLAAAQVGDVTILATLSAPPETSRPKTRVTVEDLRNAPLVVSTRVLDGSGAAKPPLLLTSRALASGGVAIAAADNPEAGAAVVWVARDNGDPEVHVTKVDKAGRKTNDVRLTTAKGDATDVAIAWAGDGWIVAWVDTRDGNGEVYATRVGLDLSRNVAERITKAPGDASDLVAHAVGDLVWLSWADPRDNPKEGLSDVFVAAVRRKDAKIALSEQRLLATAAHSRTPHLAPSSDGTSVHVAWIEEAPLGVASPVSSGYGVMWATVGASGAMARRPFKLPAAGEGAAVSVALEPSSKGLRAVVARSMTDSIVLDGVDLSAAEPRGFPLLTLDGPPSLDVALVIEGGALYFNDEGPAASDKRARRARIAWLP